MRWRRASGPGRRFGWNEAWGYLTHCRSARVTRLLRTSQTHSNENCCRLPSGPRASPRPLTPVSDSESLPCLEAVAEHLEPGPRPLAEDAPLDFGGAGLARERVGVGLPVHGPRGSGGRLDAVAQVVDPAAARVVDAAELESNPVVRLEKLTVSLDPGLGWCLHPLLKGVGQCLDLRDSRTLLAHPLAESERAGLRPGRVGFGWRERLGERRRGPKPQAQRERTQQDLLHERPPCHRRPVRQATGPPADASCHALRARGCGNATRTRSRPCAGSSAPGSSCSFPGRSRRGWAAARAS